MKPLGREAKRKFWKEHVGQWQESGLAQAEYCRIHRISEKSFGYWKRKTLPEEAPICPVELVTLESAAPKPIQLRVGNGYLIEIEKGFDSKALHQLLEVLRR